MTVPSRGTSCRPNFLQQIRAWQLRRESAWDERRPDRKVRLVCRAGQTVSGTGTTSSTTWKTRGRSHEKQMSSNSRSIALFERDRAQPRRGLRVPVQQFCARRQARCRAATRRAVRLSSCRQRSKVTPHLHERRGASGCGVPMAISRRGSPPRTPWCLVSPLARPETPSGPVTRRDRAACHAPAGT